MDAHTARSTALNNHPLYQEVLAAVRTAVTASPPQFRCEFDLGPHRESYQAYQALAARLRSEGYVVDYNKHTYELSVSWYSLKTDP